MSRIQLTLSHSTVFFFSFSALWELLPVLLLLTVKPIEFWHSRDLLIPQILLEPLNLYEI